VGCYWAGGVEAAIEASRDRLFAEAAGNEPADAEGADAVAPGDGESDDTGPALPAGATGLGAETPAISEPRPSF